jgi:hypothetical protein
VVIRAKQLAQNNLLALIVGFMNEGF